MTNEHIHDQRVRTAQLTIRTDDALVDRVRMAAANGGQSMNEFVVLVLDAATNPALAGSPGHEIRERLAAAGLLAERVEPAGPRPDRKLVRAAGSRAASGTLLSDLVSDHR
jgi:hypothetical protein